MRHGSLNALPGRREATLLHFSGTIESLRPRMSIHEPQRNSPFSLTRCPGSFRAMRPGNRGNLGNVGNVESVICRPHYPGDETNPPSPLSLFVFSIDYRKIE